MTPRCDACGHFFSYSDSSARITMITPDSAYTSETYESLCGSCAREEDAELAVAAERERCAAICRAAADEAYGEGDTRYGEFAEELWRAIVQGDHQTTSQEGAKK